MKINTTRMINPERLVQAKVGAEVYTPPKRVEPIQIGPVQQMDENPLYAALQRMAGTYREEKK